MRVAGVDGTKAGWVVVVLEDGKVVDDLLLSPVQSSFSELAEMAVIAIDVPIGFGPRQADAAARAYLSGSASTVFPIPTQAVLQAPFGPGLGVSAQAHALGPRIIHVTGVAQSNKRLHEVHPEVSFRAMNNGTAMKYRKKSAGGAFERLQLLRRHGLHVENVRATAHAPLDDVLDAAAAAWSAQRIANREAQSLPAPPEVAGRRAVAIWY